MKVNYNLWMKKRYHEKKINLTEDLQNTQQERRLINYQKYLKLWDKHENKMNKYFYSQDI